MSIKTPAAPDTVLDGSQLRIGIVHARWNKVIIDALLAGALAKLKELGVSDNNIVIQAVPGSFELPLAASKMISASQTQASATATDLLGVSSLLAPVLPDSPLPTSASSQPFDAVIAIGTLIKGSTMHFEYICEAVSQGLMKVQLDSGVPVIFGVLTVLEEGQALERAGIAPGENKGHNHGEDWGSAAVEMGSHCRRWTAGKFQ